MCSRSNRSQLQLWAEHLGASPANPDLLEPFAASRYGVKPPRRWKAGTTKTSGERAHQAELDQHDVAPIGAHRCGGPAASRPERAVPRTTRTLHVHRRVALLRLEGRVTRDEWTESRVR